MSVLTTLQVIVAVLLIAGILMQRTGAGIEGALGGGSSMESVRSTRRGFDKFVFQATIILGVAFAVLSVMHIAL